MRALKILLLVSAFSLALPAPAAEPPRSTVSKRAKAKRAKTSLKTKRTKTKRTKTKRAKTKRAKTKRAKTKRAKTKRAKTKRAKTKRAKTKRAKTKRAKTKRAKTKRATGTRKQATKKRRQLSTSSRRGAKRKMSPRAKAKLKRAKPARTISAGPKGARLVAAARRYLGYRYRLGGRGADGTFDCSGLVHRVYQDAGLSVARTARAQAAAGQAVALERARPGDVVYFGSPIHHTGIVLENKGGVLKMIHASSSRGVIVTTITASAYWNARLRGIRRYA